MYSHDESDAIKPSSVVSRMSSTATPSAAHLVARPDDRNPLAVFEELEAARAAVVAEERERDQEREPEPRGGETLDGARLLLLEEEQENRADRRQPGDD